MAHKTDHAPEILPRLRVASEDSPGQRAYERLLRERQIREQRIAALFSFVAWTVAYVLGGVIGASVSFSVLSQIQAHSGDSGGPGGLLLLIVFFGGVGLGGGLLIVGLIQLVLHKIHERKRRGEQEA